MFINLVTPCSRPENLFQMAESINIPKENYRWIVVFDDVEVPKIELPNNAEYYAHKNDQSVAGHAQRNFANTLINDGYVMQFDDDTIMHPEFWHEVKDCVHDLISWKQVNRNETHRLDAGTYVVGKIDSGSFMVKRSIIADVQWCVDKYEADGLFAEEVVKRTNDQFSIDKYLSYYNYLR